METTFKCPKCNKKIEYLKGYQEGRMDYDVSIAGGHIQYDEVEFRADDRAADLFCPECDKCIEMNDDELEEALTNKQRR